MNFIFIGIVLLICILGILFFLKRREHLLPPAGGCSPGFFPYQDGLHPTECLDGGIICSVGSPDEEYTACASPSECNGTPTQTSSGGVCIPIPPNIPKGSVPLQCPSGMYPYECGCIDPAPLTCSTGILKGTMCYTTPQCATPEFKWSEPQGRCVQCLTDGDCPEGYPRCSDGMCLSFCSGLSSVPNPTSFSYNSAYKISPLGSEQVLSLTYSYVELADNCCRTEYTNISGQTYRLISPAITFSQADLSGGSAYISNPLQNLPENIVGLYCYFKDGLLAGTMQPITQLGYNGCMTGPPSQCMIVIPNQAYTDTNNHLIDLYQLSNSSSPLDSVGQNFIIQPIQGGYNIYCTSGGTNKYLGYNGVSQTPVTWKIYQCGVFICDGYTFRVNGGIIEFVPLSKAIFDSTYQFVITPVVDCKTQNSCLC